MPPHDPGSVLLARLDPDVEVAGCARPAVKAEGVRPYDQETDVSCGERSQQIDKVRIHRSARRAGAIVPGSVSRPVGCARQAGSVASRSRRVCRPRRPIRSAWSSSVCVARLRACPPNNYRTSPIFSRQCPTRRYLAPASFNAAKRSLKSGFIATQALQGAKIQRKVPDQFQSTVGSNTRPVFQVVRVGRRVGRKPSPGGALEAV